MSDRTRCERPRCDLDRQTAILHESFRHHLVAGFSVIRARTGQLLVVAVVALVAWSCGKPSHSETISKDFTVYNESEATAIEPTALEGDGVGEASDLDYDDRETVPVLRYSAVYELEKTPRDSSDVSISYAQIKLLEPDDVDLTLVDSVHVYLLPTGANWYDSGNWRRVAISHGFKKDQRTASFNIVNRPSNVRQFIQHDDGDDEVWLAIFVVVDESVEIPEEDVKVEVDMDLEITP